jgi:hypothetical protein
MIREQLGDPLANIRGVICFGKDGVVQFKPTVAITYRKKKKDGSLCKTQSEMELSYEYCPFCGHKFENLKKIKKIKRRINNEKRSESTSACRQYDRHYCRQYIL